MGAPVIMETIAPAPVISMPAPAPVIMDTVAPAPMISMSTPVVETIAPMPMPMTTMAAPMPMTTMAAPMVETISPVMSAPMTTMGTTTMGAGYGLSPTIL